MMMIVFLLWEEGSVWQDLTVLKLLASLKFGATLMGFREVESAVTAVKSALRAMRLIRPELIPVSVALSD